MGVKSMAEILKIEPKSIEEFKNIQEYLENQES
jgi:hypothetical protein